MTPDDWIKQKLDKEDTTEGIIAEALSEYGIRGAHRV
jgi:hypothetical protein